MLFLLWSNLFVLSKPKKQKTTLKNEQRGCPCCFIMFERWSLAVEVGSDQFAPHGGKIASLSFSFHALLFILHLSYFLLACSTPVYTMRISSKRVWKWTPGEILSQNMHWLCIFVNNRYRHCKLWVKNSRSILTIQFVRLSANCNIFLFHFLFPPQIKYSYKIIQSQFSQNHLQVIQKVQTTFCNWTNLHTSRILWVCPTQIGWSDRLLCCCCFFLLL